MAFLMLTDSQRADMQAVLSGEYSCVVGEDGGGEWSLVQRADEASPIEPGAWLYVEGTEFAGVADRVTADTAEGTVTWSGRTWAGVLASNVARADPGQANLRVSGDANAVLRSLVQRAGLSDCIEADLSPSGVQVSYEFPRYADLWTGCREMLRRAGGRLSAAWDPSVRRLRLSAVEARPADASGTSLPMAVTRTYRAWNHIVAAGEGEGAQRVEAEWFADANGKVSKTQTFFGADRRSYFYDYGSSKDIEEDARKKLEELQEADEVEVFPGGAEGLFVGDRCRADAPMAGIAPVCEIDRKQVDWTLGTRPEYSYEAGRSRI